MNESQIFAAALKLTDPEERAAYLDGVCVGNPQLRADVEALLRAYGNDPGFLEQPPVPPGQTIDADLLARSADVASASLAFPGAILAGRYKLLEEIGEGGMGTVWMAQQIEPVKRLVAVKLIKAGMDSRQVIARFEAERQALALMDHPNIARVHDAGTTSEGRPFFVMELVKGVPITRYCDEHRLTPRQRLELFIPVCQAVQHAHQKGIIHRDIKPSNVLVSPYDGKPVPKVIDFGVAKAAGQPLTDKTLVTGFGNIVGTLEYMSPEQAEINQLDIDTRSDIYSLGVLLYELLTGSPPFSRKELEEVGILEMLRVIREQEPTKPSTKLSTAEGLPSLAANRGTEPAKLTKLVRGELDWIVMKALEKDRNRRYETANAFASDIQRYLADEPVQACPPSVGYRLWKFYRRNRRGLIFAAALGVMLVIAVGAVAGAVGWSRAEAAAHRVAANSGADLALHDARSFLAVGRRDDAQTALDRADAFRATDPSLADRALALRGEMELIHRLDRVRTQGVVRLENGKFDYQSADTAYAAVFQKAGFDMSDTERVAAALAELASVLDVATALDDWAGVRLARKDQSGAQQLLTIASRIDPDSYRNRVRDALGRSDRAALEALANPTALARQPAITAHQVGKALFDIRAFHAAVRVLKPAVIDHPGDFWLNYTLADALGRSQRSNEATCYLIAAAALRPNDDLVGYKLGFHLSGPARNPELGAAWLRRVVRLRPDLTDAYIFLGNALEKSGDWPGALAAYKEVVRLRPNGPWPYYYLSRALGRTGAWEEAYAVLEANVKRLPPRTQNPQGDWQWNTVASHFEELAWAALSAPDPKLRNIPFAIRAAKRVNELYLRPLSAALGEAHYRAGDYAAAAAALSTPEQRRRVKAECYLAMTRAKLNEPAAARKHFANAVLTIEQAHAGDAGLLDLAAEMARETRLPLPPTLRPSLPAERLAPAPGLRTPAHWEALSQTVFDANKKQWTATLRWEPVAGATRYHVQLTRLDTRYRWEDPEKFADFVDQPNAIDRATVRMAEFKYTLAVGKSRKGEPRPTAFRWRVRALVSDVWTAWSEDRIFWVNPPALGLPKVSPAKN